MKGEIIWFVCKTPVTNHPAKEEASSEVIIHVGSGHTKAVITSWAQAPKCSLQTLASLLLMHAQLLCKGNYRHQREFSASDLRIKDGVLIPVSFLQASDINGKNPVRFPIPPLVKSHQQAQGWLAWRTSLFPGVFAWLFLPTSGGFGPSCSAGALCTHWKCRASITWSLHLLVLRHLLR